MSKATMISITSQVLNSEDFKQLKAGNAVESLPNRLRKACNGHPYAKIPWPHRILHEAADHIEKIEVENKKLKSAVKT